jgi:hypothetical protein
MRDKMSEVLVSTKAFTAMLTHPVKNVSNGAEALIEVIPTISSGFKDISLVEDFFSIISIDQSEYGKKAKKARLDRFVNGATRRLIEEFWDTRNFDSLKRCIFSAPVIECVLYDKSGKIIQSTVTHAVDVITALKKLELACYLQGMPESRQKMLAVQT